MVVYINNNNIEKSLEYLQNLQIIGLDVEATGLDEYSKILLVGLGDFNNQYIFDKNNFKYIFNLLNSKNIIFVGHNIKYDIKIIKTNFNILLNKVYDTMIADQRIFQGCGKTKYNPYGLKFDLDSTTKRYFNIYRETNKEEIRSNFINQNINTYIPNNIEIQYLAEDIKYLTSIREKQLISIKKLNLIFQQIIEQNLVRTLARIELFGGMYLDITKWKKNIEENKKIIFETELKLDNIFKKLRANNINANPFLKGGIFDNKRNKIENLIQTDLFGNNYEIKLNKLNNINWKSSTQIIYIFARLQLAIPTIDDKFLVPIFINNKIVKYRGVEQDKINYYNDEDIQGHLGFTTNTKYFQQYFKKTKNKLVKEFISNYIILSEAITALNNFGENYISKIDKNTGKIHTIFRQCEAITGRLQSGGGKKQPNKINCQNIKRDNKYRNCFIAPKNCSIITADLSSAEALILADKSNDKNLIRLEAIEKDTHSPISQTSWRNVYLFRALVEENLCQDNKTFWEIKKYINASMFTRENSIKNYELSNNLIISKSENKNLRNEFKNITFGTIYGAKAKTIAKQLNVNIEEGQIILDTIKKLMPDAFKYIEDNIKFVLGVKNKYNNIIKYPNGYLVLNQRTNSTIWFTKVLKELKNNKILDYEESKDIQGLIRNVPIQGTQADMIKEAMVIIDKTIEKYELPNTNIIFQIHDELVIMCDKRMDGKSKEWLNNPIKIRYKNEYIDFPKYVANIMKNTANNYLTNVKMNVEYQVEDYWVK